MNDKKQTPAQQLVEQVPAGYQCTCAWNYSGRPWAMTLIRPTEDSWELWTKHLGRFTEYDMVNCLASDLDDFEILKIVKMEPIEVDPNSY